MGALIDDLRWRGLVHQVTDERGLSERLAAPGVVGYIGFDPTADSLHVGHLQQLCLLRLLQEAGHRPIALIGGGTGMIGDPSGKSEERNLLKADELSANRDAIERQIARFLDVEEGGPSRLVDNAEWLVPALLLEFLREVGKHFSVNEMVRKDSVRARLEEREQSLSFTEFSYMLLQAWDFVQLHDRYGCELQLGGSDQWGNIVEGVDLIRRLRNAPAFGLTSPLVTKSDGAKFGKTEAGTIWLDGRRTSPYEFFQFWLRTTDADAGPYLRRFTLLDEGRIEELEEATRRAPERREAQRALALAVTSAVHGPEEARRAERAASVLFTDEIGSLDERTLATALEDAPKTTVARSALDGLAVVDALGITGLAASRREARALLSGGAVYVNGARADEGRTLASGDALHGRWVVLRRGKHRQHVLVVER